MGRILVGAVLALLVLAPSAAAEEVFETYYVPTVDGAEVSVDVMRDDSVKRGPVLLTYSPYNTLSEGAGENQADDALGERFVPKGYVRAVADVLGTRNSSGCWDYGGPKETQSGVDLVKFLAKQPWSNGRVGMIGGSYEGTTANMVASRGPEVPQLKAIVPIAAISRWYGYAYQDGVRFFLNSEEATDEGFDTPLAFDFGLARTPPTNLGDERFGGTLASRADVCESAEHTTKGYDDSPDYDEFWQERDYRRRARDFRAAVLIAHGWQDYNVKQEEGTALFEALKVRRTSTTGKPTWPGVPLKRLWLTQGSHGSPSGDAWDRMLQRFLDRYLLGRQTGVERTPLVTTEGRTVTDDGSYESLGFRTEDFYPGTRLHRYWLRRTFDQDIPGVQVPPPGTGETGVLSPAPNTEERDNVFTWVGAPTSEELGNRDPLNEPGHGYYSLFFGTAPLASPLRIYGSPRLDGWFRTPAGGHLSPVLVDVAPDGTMTTIARGFLNMDYRDGLEAGRPAGGQWVHATVRLLPQDVTIRPGHRIGLLLQSSNTVWAVPGRLGTNNVLTGPLSGVSSSGTSLVLPVAQR